MKKSNNYNIKLMLTIASILLISSFLYFQLIIPYHLRFKEQIQLFLFDSTYILSYFSKPGGLACLAGDFLTQFFYFKSGGPVVLSLLIVFTWLIIVRILNSFGVKQMASIWALLPVIALWGIIGEINASVGISVAFALVLLAILIYIQIRNRIISIATGILFIPVLYALLGSAMFLFPVFVPLFEIFNKQKRYYYWLILFVLAVIIPCLFRSGYLITFQQAFLYPYTGIKQTMCYAVLIAIVFIASLKSIHKLRLTILSFSLIALLILVFWIGGLTVATNLQREKILAMSTEASLNNWDQVLKIAEKSNMKNPITTYFTNLALSKKMQLGDRMMEFYQPFTTGLFLPVNPESNWFVIFFSSDVYFHIGDMNMAQHSAMLGMTFSPNHRSSFLVQRLIEINLVAGDIPAAMKYIRLLESSWFHKKNAARLKEMALSTETDDNPWLQNKRSQIHTGDILTSSHNPLPSLELLLKTNPDNQQALDYLLAFHLMNKNIPEFFKVYTNYCKGKQKDVPKMHAEALLIYFAFSKTRPERIAEYAIDTEIIRNFNEYTKLHEDSNGNLELLQEKFPHTYWLFYHFATIKNE